MPPALVSVLSSWLLPIFFPLPVPCSIVLAAASVITQQLVIVVVVVNCVVGVHSRPYHMKL